MLGTKVSTYGFTIITILAFIIYLFFTLIKKEVKYKNSVLLFLILMIGVTIYTIPSSPAASRTSVEQENIAEYEEKNKEIFARNYAEIYKNVEQKYRDKKGINGEVDKSLEEMFKELTKEEKNELLLDFIANNYDFYHINPQFIIVSYPYEYDVEFWFNIMNMSLAERTNFRYVEELMLKRVILV